MGQHKAQQCDHRMVACRDCGVGHKKVDQDAHKVVCGAIPLTCNWCGAELVLAGSVHYVDSFVLLAALTSSS